MLFEKGDEFRYNDETIVISGVYICDTLDDSDYSCISLVDDKIKTYFDISENEILKEGWVKINA